MSEKESTLKKILTWKLSEDMMVITLEAQGMETLTFSISDFWKSSRFERLEDVERLCVWNGLKQKLVDKTAASKDLQLSVAEKCSIISETWERLCNRRAWNKPSESRKGVVTKIDSALSKANEAELGMMLKLGLVTQEKYDAEIDRRTAARQE